MGDNSQSTIQWGVGILCALIMAYMLYVSGGPNRNYDIVAIIGMLSLIAILLGYQELLVRILQVWRGETPDVSRREQKKKDDESRSKITRLILEDIRQEQRQRERERSRRRGDTATDTNTNTNTDQNPENENENEPRS